MLKSIKIGNQLLCFTNPRKSDYFYDMEKAVELQESFS